MREIWVLSLGWEDPLEEDMATNSSILAWRTPWTEETGGVQSMGLQESDTTERLNTTVSIIIHIQYMFNIRTTTFFNIRTTSFKSKL